MNILWATLTTAAVAGVAVAAMLLVRRQAPEGGYFEDGDRAAGVFGVLATGFSVLLGFIVFLAFASYDQSRAGAEQEALTVVQQVENAQFFPRASRGQLTAEIICYGRSVVNDEWERMRAGTQGDAINPWAVRLFRTLQTVQPQSAAEQSAYDKWLEQTSTREEARRDRIHGAVGVIPIQLWIVLFFIAAVIFVFMLFFADSGERAVVQGMLIGSVVSVITVLLLLLNGLNSPFHDGVGGLKPVAMERSLRQIDEALGAVDAKVEAPVRRSRGSGVFVSAADGGRDRVELVATMLLAVATVATAWSGYQSTRWNGEQAKAGARANALRIESAKFAGLANTQTVVDVSVFTDWVNAYAEDKTELADFYFTRFRKEFKPAVAAWIATRPLKNPNAPPTPFAMPQYRLEARAESERLSAEAEVFGGTGAARHPARVELRARRRPVCVVALLRRHEHQVGIAETARCDALDRVYGLHPHRRVDRDLAGQHHCLGDRSRSAPRPGHHTSNKVAGSERRLRKDSPSRWRFCPLSPLTFRFRVRPSGGASTYSRSVLGASRNLRASIDLVKSRAGRIGAVCALLCVRSVSDQGDHSCRPLAHG